VRWALVAAGVLLSAAAPAYAGTVSPQTAALCTGARVTCSVQLAPTVTEGGPAEVVVTGRGGVDVEVQAFRVSGTTLTPYGPSAALTTDSDGFGVAELRLPSVPDGESGGPLLVATADSARTADLADVLGTWTTLVSRRPLVLGDGYATDKPVGTRLGLELAGVAPGSGFDVELQRDGQWQSVGADPDATCPGTGTSCVVGWEVPRGLEPGTYAVRLVNRATGTAVAGWDVAPSDTGTALARTGAETPPVGAGVAGSATESVGATTNAVPRPRSQGLDVPDVASDVAGAGSPAEHSPATVHLVAGVLAALLALVAVGGTTRRRRA
jgi:hypothetical protein